MAGNYTLALPDLGEAGIRPLRDPDATDEMRRTEIGHWRVSENDPDSGLYAVSRDADTVIQYMTANS